MTSQCCCDDCVDDEVNMLGKYCSHRGCGTCCANSCEVDDGMTRKGNYEREGKEP